MNIVFEVLRLIPGLSRISSAAFAISRPSCGFPKRPQSNRASAAKATVDEGLKPCFKDVVTIEKMTSGSIVGSTRYTDVARCSFILCPISYRSSSSSGKLAISSAVLFFSNFFTRIYSKRFTGFTHFGGGPFGNAASGNPASGAGGHQHNPFTKQHDAAKDDDDIIEGEFEERPDQDHQIGNKKNRKT